jgi:hypothetical protein
VTHISASYTLPTTLPQLAAIFERIDELERSVDFSIVVYMVQDVVSRSTSCGFDSALDMRRQHVFLSRVQLLSRCEGSEAE